MSYLNWIARTQPEMIVGLATGKIALPDWIGATQPSEGGGFPPALIPLWYRDGPAYFGIWKHWHCARQESFVRFDLEADCAREIARTPSQLIRALLLPMLTITQKSALADIRRLASEAGMSAEDLRAIEEIAETTGDEFEFLLALEDFQREPPQICFSDEEAYPGQFPTLPALGRSEFLRTICSLEIDPDLNEKLELASDCPPWLKEGPKLPTFFKLLEAGDLGAAWLCLNSTGWTFGEARRALPKLVEKSSDAGLAEIADCWLAIDHGDQWTY